MNIINFSEQNSVMNHYMAEIRDKSYQKNRLLFRNNIERIGEMMAYEISKSLTYKTKTVTTPLGTIDIPLVKDEVVLATVLRAGLPFHEGFLSYYDGADNAFVSAYRKYFPKTDDFVVHIEYIASPRLDDKTLVIVDPMLATGTSMELAYQALVTKGHPAHIHVASVVATPQAIEVVRQHLPNEKTTLWTCDIDNELNEHSYIVPGLGDCGDLLYGEKE